MQLWGTISWETQVRLCQAHKYYPLSRVDIVVLPFVFLLRLSCLLYLASLAYPLESVHDRQSIVE